MADAQQIVDGSLALTARAIDTGQLTQLDLAQGAAADLAELAATAVDEQLLLKVAGLAVTTDEIAQGGAAALDGVGEDALDLIRQPHIALPRDRTRLAPRIDASGEQGLGRIDIADPDHHPAVPDKELDRHAAAARLLEQ